VGNGWYARDTGEIRFWQQSNHLVQGKKFYEGIETAKLFWWFNQGAPVRWYATPKPHYGCDGSKAFGILDETECQLVDRLGEFPFPSFWGPKAGIASSQWIANAAAMVLRRHRPALTLVYLPHLDYDYQRSAIHDPQRVAEVDLCAGKLLDAAGETETEVIIVSEYGLVPVHQPILINRSLRTEGLVSVRDGPYGEVLMPLESKAFAVADHQIAHVYVADRKLQPRVRQIVEEIEGVDAVVDPGDLELDHHRSGDLIALAKPQAWFCYYYWLDERRAPDFARTVDIHRKPGYDPCELFLTSKVRASFRLAQKKLGMRYRMDVIPLRPELVGGSHGLQPEASAGPLVIGPGAPSDMRDFGDYVRGLLQ
jgi:predicted AlkP superfamily pyrophosphatase or phosphodiesterase